MIHVKILTKAASVIAIVAWLRSSLTEVAIQFDERNGQRVWIEDCCSFCLLDLLDFIAIGIWFRLNSREKVWWTKCAYWGGVWSAEFKLLASMSWNSARIKRVDTMLRMHIHIAPPVMTTVVAAWGERRTYHWRLEQRQSSYDWPLLKYWTNWRHWHRKNWFFYGSTMPAKIAKEERNGCLRSESQ